MSYCTPRNALVCQGLCVRRFYSLTHRRIVPMKSFTIAQSSGKDGSQIEQVWTKNKRGRLLPVHVRDKGCLAACLCFPRPLSTGVIGSTVSLLAKRRYETSRSSTCCVAWLQAFGPGRLDYLVGGLHALNYNRQRANACVEGDNVTHSYYMRFRGRSVMCGNSGWWR